MAVFTKIDPTEKYLHVLKSEESRVQMIGRMLKKTMKLDVSDNQLQKLYTTSIGKIKTKLMG